MIISFVSSPNYAKGHASADCEAGESHQMFLLAGQHEISAKKVTVHTISVTFTDEAENSNGSDGPCSERTALINISAINDTLKNVPSNKIQQTHEGFSGIFDTRTDKKSLTNSQSVNIQSNPAQTHLSRHQVGNCVHQMKSLDSAITDSDTTENSIKASCDSTSSSTVNYQNDYLYDQSLERQVQLKVYSYDELESSTNMKNAARVNYPKTTMV